MRDIWGFLLQTLTASGAAVLLLIVKAMFRDKLPPKWQFAVWAVLGGVLVVPAGIFGRYTLVNWPAAVETLKTLLTGEYTLTRVILPFPLPVTEIPSTAAEWLFLIYELGVLFFLAKYILSYIRLGNVLRKQEGLPGGIHAESGGTEEEGRLYGKVRETAEKYRFPFCRAVEAEGIGSAFIFGNFRPVLVYPAGKEPDEKIILHELIHLRARDTLWGILICIFRCIHWCNPLLWYCADLAGNDIEARCDQRVLELLKGEERRDYGRILLSMANEKYARMPGTSSMANGGKNISRRIESIVRFKKYPSGMALVSVCIALALAFPALAGEKGEVFSADQTEKYTDGYMRAYAMAAARTRWCTTPAGALDTYGKALLEENGIYRAMCAPLEMQERIAEEIRDASGWKGDLEGTADAGRGYYVYNLESTGRDSYSAVMVIPLLETEEDTGREDGKFPAAVQRVSVRLEGSRWVVIQESSEIVETSYGLSPEWGNREFPAYFYTGTAADFRVDIQYQQVFEVDNTITDQGSQSAFFGYTEMFDTVPRPDAEFDRVYQSSLVTCTYIGTEEGKSGITDLGITAVPADEPDTRPEFPELSNVFYAVSDTAIGNTHSFEETSGWDPVIDMGGSGGTTAFEKPANEPPRCYAANLYINEKLEAEMTLERTAQPEETE